MKKFGVDRIINPKFFVSFHQFLPSVYTLTCVVQCLLHPKMTDSVSLDCFKPIMTQSECSTARFEAEK